MSRFSEFDLVDLGISNNCLSCSRYVSCTDPQKAFSYSCTRFKRLDAIGIVNQLTDATHAVVDRHAVQVAISDPLSAERSKFSIRDILDNAISSSPMVAADIRLPDSDFPEALNFLEFATSDKFLKQRPYVAQAIIAIIVFAEYCPKCSDCDYLFHDHKVTDTLAKLRRKVCLLEKGVCPSCKKNRKYYADRGMINFYNEMAVCAGQRSGKSALTGMMVAYIVHRLIKLQNPNEVYGLMSSNVLHGTFVALTYKQAKDNLWDPIMGNILGSPWFSEYHEMLRSYESREGEYLKLKDEFLQYNCRRFIIYPAGPDKRVLRGRTRAVGSVDELGWFDNSADSGKVKINAREIYAAMGNSLTTIRAKSEVLFSKGFYNILPGYFLNISSPSSTRDKIMEMVRLSNGSTKIYGVLKPTWEMNPDVPFTALAEEYRKDPIGAARDFGVQPPLSSSPFISSQEVVEKCINPKKSNPCTYTHVLSKSKTSKGRTTRFAKFTSIKKSRFPSVLALDAGFSNNSFACVCAHLKDHRFPVIDFMIEIMPQPGIPLNYSKIYTHVLVPIIKARNIRLVAADRWNSLKILHDIEEELTVQTLIYSLKYVDMQVFKDHVMDTQVQFLAPEMDVDDILNYKHAEYPECFKGKPASHFILQSLTVQDTGNSVTKGDQLTDDLFRAGMLASRVLLDSAYSSYFADSNIVEIAPTVNVSDMAFYRGASSGGSTASSNGSYVGSSGMPLGVSRSRS